MPGAGGRENGEWLPADDENVLELDRGDGCTHCEYSKCHWIVTLKMVSFMLCEFHLSFLKDRENQRQKNNSLLWNN